jgi:hypothetical protein
LLSRLPKSGDVWPEADRKLWLQLLEGSFKLIYKDKSDKKARAQNADDVPGGRLEERLKKLLQ